MPPALSAIRCSVWTRSGFSYGSTSAVNSSATRFTPIEAGDVMQSADVRAGFTAMAAIRAGNALLLGLFIEFVALTLISPLWETSGSRADFAVGAVLGTLLSFGCGCLIALIAGPFAMPVFTVVA